MSIKVRGFAGILFLIALGMFLISCGTSSSRLAGVLLVTSEGASSVTSYGINLSTGGLSQINTSAQTQNVPSSIVLDPSGAFAYVTNSASNTLSAYSVNPNGTLTAVSGNPATGTTPVALAIDHAGHFLFVANRGSNDVSVFSVDSGGSVTLVGSFPTGTLSATSGATPASVAVDPSVNFLYVADMNSNQVSGYHINPSNGELTALAQAPSTGTRPVFVAIHPGGLYLYVANIGSDSLSGFKITAKSGVLAPLAPVSTAAQPSAIALK